jgi:glycosyltransferase involved in cell wall biosynthesis
MRIALLSAEYPPQPGGVGDYTARLGGALVERGHPIVVFTIVDCRLQIVDLGGSNLNLQSTIYNLQSDWGWRSWRAISAALDHSRPDILHIQYQTGAYDMHPAINLLPWRLRRLRRRPLVAVTAHDLLLPYLFPKAGPLRRWVTRRLLADGDAVVVTNKADYEQIVGHGQWAIGRRTSIISQSHIADRPPPVLIPIGSNVAVAPPPGYQRAVWRGRLHVASDQILVAFFGLMTHTKGLEVLLDALGRLPASVRLLIIGGAASAPEDRAYAGQIQRQIAAHGLAPRVTITGHCPADQVSGHLLAADLAALPFGDGASFRRGSLLAALAHGLPTVTTFPAKDERWEMEDIHANCFRLSSPVLRPLEDEENALLVAPGDAQALAGAIARLASDLELRERLATGGRALAQQFAWPAIAEQHEALYTELMHRSELRRQ